MILFPMDRRHHKTLQAIFDEPVRADLEWKAIEKMLDGLGAEISEGRSSRMRIQLNGVRAVFHRPYPEKEVDRGALKAMRRFLQQAGSGP